MYGVLRALQRSLGTTRFIGPEAVTTGLGAAFRLRAIGPPPKPPNVEVHLSGWLHSKGRDAAAIRHHYDICDEFYRIVLGPAMTYSCARWEPGEATLEGPSVPSTTSSVESLACKTVLKCACSTSAADGARWHYTP